MWQTFFRICNFLCNFIPNREKRERIRRDRLYDWAKKYTALRQACPEIKFHHVKMIKGGWNIGFIINHQYVFKIRKFFSDEKNQIEKIMREKRMTDAFADIVSLKIPNIEIIRAGEYTFYRYNFISGHNMNTFSLRTIRKYERQWGKQIAEFIYKMHNARPKEINDLKTAKGDGWNHHDICNNIIVNPKTMKIIGLIDWEYSGWGPLETEIINCTLFSKKIRQTNMDRIIRAEYKKLADKKARKN